MKKTRLMVIGLDAADKDLIESWAADGVLPTFRRLQNSSLWADIENPVGLEAGCCWPTFYFGLMPAKTAQFDGSRHFDPKSYGFVSYNPDQNIHDPIWTTLSKAGKFCGVIDAPYSYPAGQINGIKIVDRAGHVPAGGGGHMKFRTYPEELAAEIIEKFGPDPARGQITDSFSVKTTDEVIACRRMYIERLQKKAEMALHYWKQQPFDFFMTVFTEAHSIGHLCWHLHDPDHPQHDTEIVREVGDPLKDVYVALDEAVATLINGIDDNNVNILVYLSHGMGPRRSATKILDRILARLEGARISTQSGPVMSALRSQWRTMPEWIRRPLFPLRNRVSRDGFQPGRQTRRYFEVFANDGTGGIRINLAGRERRGIVQPGKEFEDLCSELVSDIKAIKNAETGRPLAQEILITRDHYAGEFLDFLPDILVIWDRMAPIRTVTSPKIGSVDATGLTTDRRTGDHRPAGRFFALAPDWPAQRLNSTVRAEDFAPTIARILGVEPPDTDGQAISALLKRLPQTDGDDMVLAQPAS